MIGGFVRYVEALRGGSIIVALGWIAEVNAQVTESPQAVAPRAFLLETDVVAYSADRASTAEGGGRTRALTVASSLLSTGLREGWDVQFGYTPYVRERTEGPEGRSTVSGGGDVVLRSRWQFHASHASASALAVLPYVKLPTNSGGVGNDAVEGGIILPWATTQPSGWEMGAMLQWDRVRNDADTGHESHAHASAYLALPLGGNLGGYVETTIMHGLSRGGGGSGTVGAGVTWSQGKDLAWDFAVVRGVSRRATDWTFALRLTWNL